MSINEYKGVQMSANKYKANPRFSPLPGASAAGILRLLARMERYKIKKTMEMSDIQSFGNARYASLFWPGADLQPSSIQPSTG